MNPFKSAIKSIGKNCQKNSLILVETTVPPGTCEKVVKPIINEELKNLVASENVVSSVFVRINHLNKLQK